jgi:hypothetical protein
MAREAGGDDAAEQELRERADVRRMVQNAYAPEAPRTFVQNTVTDKETGISATYTKRA